MLYKMVLTFESVDEILKGADKYSNPTYWTVSTCGKVSLRKLKIICRTGLLTLLEGKHLSHFFLGLFKSPAHQAIEMGGLHLNAMLTGPELVLNVLTSQGRTSFSVNLLPVDER